MNVSAVPTGFRKTLRERFRAKVDRSGGPDACHRWTAGTRSGGYGVIRMGGAGSQVELAHRVAYMLAIGPIPEGYQVCHRCDQRTCVNPCHLFLGTPADNSADMKQKGRQTFGSRNPMAKLAEADVREILALRGRIPATRVAARYGVTDTTIRAIFHGRAWVHVSIRGGHADR